MFLNITAEIERWDEISDKKSCCLILKDNPLAEFVILPLNCQNSLWYSNIICGIIRGALDMLNIEVKAYFLKDTLRGDIDTIIKVEFERVRKN